MAYFHISKLLVLLSLYLSLLLPSLSVSLLLLLLYYLLWYHHCYYHPCCDCHHHHNYYIINIIPTIILLPITTIITTVIMVDIAITVSITIIIIITCTLGTTCFFSFHFATNNHYCYLFRYSHYIHQHIITNVIIPVIETIIASMAITSFVRKP